ncbi:ShlB/FhaC/HecB family hemolysin secretion/activation protein [Orbaceae bacterium ac157xtp]
MKKYTIKNTLALLTLSCVLAPHSYALIVPTEKDKQISDQQLIHQQERQKAMDEVLQGDAPDVHLLPPSQKTDRIEFPTEALCFPINKVELINRETLPYLVPLYPLSSQAEGKCLGGEGINLLMGELQNRLVAYGYITTRVLAPEQDLATGTLQLLLIKGTVRNVYYSNDSDTHTKLSTTMPIKQGEILNLRDIEQGLENLQRFPTMNANMELIPGDNPGESDVMITRAQSKYWRVGLSVDDSGTKDTGRHQGGLTFYLDNPLGLSDGFYVSGGHDLSGESKYGSKNYSFSYSVPFGYWLFNTSFNGSNYHQTVAGTPDYKYSGRSKSSNIQLSRVIHRNESQKTTLSYGLTFKESRNYIDDTEIELQHRRTTFWKLGFDHRHYIDDITLDIGANYQKGVRWFGALKAPEEESGEGTALSEILSLSASASVPFTLADQRFNYDLSYQGQLSRNGDLTPQERFSIGSRWTVRGFNGELTLSADNGWFLRNELSWITPINNVLYLGVDTGEVSGANSGYLLGHRLTGGVIGLKGSHFGLYYDGFIGTPLHKPEGFKTDNVVLGFNLNWSY